MDFVGLNQLGRAKNTYCCISIGVSVTMNQNHGAIVSNWCPAIIRERYYAFICCPFEQTWLVFVIFKYVQSETGNNANVKIDPQSPPSPSGSHISLRLHQRQIQWGFRHGSCGKRLPLGSHFRWVKCVSAVGKWIACCLNSVCVCQLSGASPSPPQRLWSGGPESPSLCPVRWMDFLFHGCTGFVRNKDEDWNGSDVSTVELGQYLPKVCRTSLLSPKTLHKMLCT